MKVPVGLMRTVDDVGVAGVGFEIRQFCTVTVLSVDARLSAEV